MQMSMKWVLILKKNIDHITLDITLYEITTKKSKGET